MVRVEVLRLGHLEVATGMWVGTQSTIEDFPPKNILNLASSLY